MQTRTATVLALLGAVALFAIGDGVLVARDRTYPLTPAAADESLTIASGDVIKHLSVGYTALAADLYWIRTIQYFGGRRLELAGQLPGTDGAAPGVSRSYPLLYPLLDVTTTLDPRFNLAYRFGSIFLAEPYPGGADRPDLAIALLEKGLRARPEKWEYMQDIGFVHYWWIHDYKAAAEWFDKASRVPGAPWWLRSLAAVTLAEGGDRRSSRVMWTSIRQSAELEWLRNEADRRLMQLQALDELDFLQTNRGRVRAAPVDPAGVPYEIDGSGHVQLSRKSPLYPLPVEPQRIFTPAS
jgi:hypothetical protein